MHECFVGVLTLLLEQVFIAADYSLWAKAHMEVLLLLVSEANCIDSSLIDRLTSVTTDYIDMLINFVILLKNVLARTVATWL